MVITHLKKKLKEMMHKNRSFNVKVTYMENKKEIAILDCGVSLQALRVMIFANLLRYGLLYHLDTVSSIFGIERAHQMPT